ASSREFTNYNKCHAVTYMFYRINKKQKIKFELESIERRVYDSNAPIGGVLQPATLKLPIALVPQDIPATAILRKTTNAAGVNATSNFNATAFSITNSTPYRAGFSIDQNFSTPLDDGIRAEALKEVDQQLIAKRLLNNEGKVASETKLTIDFEMEFSLPTPGIIVKGCLDDCDVCEPLLKEKMQLENDLLRKQIELLEKSQEYRCCPATSVTSNN
ncbi:MAG: hypothetical protein H7320_00180, partial [Ferruginibacter sp.]|nr:hypothetical protein [Ferruginibacter sp.]